MISKMMRGSIKLRVFSSLLFPILLLEILMFTGYYTYNVNMNQLRYEKIAETISTPFIRTLQEKLLTFHKIEDRKGFLRTYAKLKGAIDFDVWKKQYNNFSGVSFVDESSHVLADVGGVEKFGHLKTGKIRTIVSKRTKGQFAVAVPLLVDDHYYGALEFWFPDKAVADKETIAFAVALIVLVVSMVLGVFWAWWMSTSITKPINIIAAESTHIAAGELDHDISYLASDNEIGLLVKNFHQMRDSIREKINALEDGNLKLLNEINERKNAERELQKHRDKLEVIVKERTKNLTDVNRALADSETFLNELINAIPAPVFYKDRAGKYLGFNQAFESFFGQTKEQMIGKTVFDINPHELAELYQAKDIQLFEDGGIQQYEAQVRDATGQLREVIFYKAVYNDSEGGIRGLIGTILDITERKKIEEALRKNQERLRLLAESSEEILYQLDLNGEITFVSPAFERISGYTLDEVLNRNYTLFFAASELENLKETISIAIAGESYQLVAFIGKRKDNSTFPFEVSVTPIIKDGEIIGVQGIARDITERKLLEEQQEKLIIELKEALERINTLRGLIPICSNCKKIRDDKGYWNYLETFIEQHSDASFSHGLCPDCTESLYGKEQWYIQRKKKKK